MRCQNTVIFYPHFKSMNHTQSIGWSSGFKAYSKKYHFFIRVFFGYIYSLKGRI